MPDVINDFEELGHFDLDPKSMRLLSLAFCQHNHVAILGTVEKHTPVPVSVGMLNIKDAALVHRIEQLLQRKVKPVRLNVYEIKRALQVGFTQRKPSEHVVNVTQILNTRKIPDNAPALLDEILALAVSRRASDIHIESYLEDVDLRFRMDGILHQVFTHLHPDNVSSVINRIKIIAGLDITEQRRPQDGRFSVTFLENAQQRTIDFRVSIVPSVSEEDVVIRILDSDIGLVGIDMLGMTPDVQQLLIQLLHNPEGMILVTGPTGSGKTTTLYASLSHICDGKRKIITAEDPIEFYLPKINQKQLTPQMGIHSLLRAMLRQDPDVLLVGEVRDKETGEMAMMASATGHLVLGTLHTSDAIGSLLRLRGLDLENRDIAGTLLAVIAQRLVRTLCPLCAKPTAASEAQKQLFGPLINGMPLFAPVGCPKCYNTGYRGRIGLFEMLMVDSVIQGMIVSDETPQRIREVALERGFVSIATDGLHKVSAGVTTLDELERVLPLRSILAARQEHEQATAVASTTRPDQPEQVPEDQPHASTPTGQLTPTPPRPQ